MTIDLQQTHGTNATQDLTNLTLVKADFADVGLSPDANDSAQALVAAQFLKWAAVLTEENQNLDSSQLITIARDLESITTRGGNTYTRVSYSINFDKLTPTITIDPDDF
ncbi:MAG TPA: hypothetical protein V6C95_23465 [Coleofasciculaceae cyanobacterium]